MRRGLDGIYFPFLACVQFSSLAGAWSRLISVVIARGKHLFPFRTEPLSPSAPMVLGGQPPGRVGRRRFFSGAVPSGAALVSSLRVRYGEQLPFFRDSLQRAPATVLEGDPRPGDQVLHRARHENLPWLRCVSDPSCDVDCDAPNLPGDPLALSRMDSGSDRDPQRLQLFGDRSGCADRPSRPLKRGEKSVSGGVDLLAAERRELAPDDRVMVLETLAPAAIAKFRGALGRPHDVGDQHGG